MNLPSPTNPRKRDKKKNSKRKQKSQSTSKEKTKIRFSDLSKAARIQYRKRAFELFEKGLGYCATSRILGLSLFTVRDWHRLYKGGYFDPDLKSPGNSLPNILPMEIKKKVKEEFANGASVTSLAKRYGKSNSTIRYWLRENNS